MPTLFKLPTRRHTKYRRVSITLDFVWMNPNPPHIFDCTDKNLEERLARIVRNNMMETLPLSDTMTRGFLNNDFMEDWNTMKVSVRSRECDDHGKPLSLLQRIVYLITGRYRR